MYNTISRRMLNKLKAIKLMGGKCIYCNECHPAKLTFHHKDPKEKDDLVSKLLAGDFNSLYLELKKCILLCSNCHRELHYKENANENLTNSKITFLEFKNIFNCEECGYNKCVASLDFHHIKDKKKRVALFNFECKGKSVEQLTDSIKNELSKCKILCSNCHQKHHSSLNKFEEDDYVKLKPLLDKITFNENFSEKEIINHFLRNGENYRITAKEFNIYASTVKKILLKYNIIKHSPKIDENVVLKLHKEGKQNIEIAKLLNCNMRTIERILTKFNLTARKYVDREGIKKYFLENPTKSNKEISVKFNCSLWSVQTILQPLRKK